MAEGLKVGDKVRDVTWAKGRVGVVTETEGLGWPITVRYDEALGEGAYFAHELEKVVD